MIKKTLLATAIISATSVKACDAETTYEYSEGKKTVGEALTEWCEGLKSYSIVPPTEKQLQKFNEWANNNHKMSGKYTFKVTKLHFTHEAHSSKIDVIRARYGSFNIKDLMESKKLGIETAGVFKDHQYGYYSFLATISSNAGTWMTYTVEL